MSKNFQDFLNQVALRKERILSNGGYFPSANVELVQNLYKENILSFQIIEIYKANGDRTYKVYVPINDRIEELREEFIIRTNEKEEYINVFEITFAEIDSRLLDNGQTFIKTLFELQKIAETIIKCELK